MRAFAFVLGCLTLSACASRPLGPPDGLDPNEPGGATLHGKSHFFLGTDTTGAIRLVRVDGPSSEVVAVAPALPIGKLSDVNTFVQAGERALVQDVVGSRSLALRDGAWIDLCAAAGYKRCYAQAMDTRLEFLAINPDYREAARDVPFFNYDGMRIGTANGSWVAPAAGRGDEPPWLVWREDGVWWVYHRLGGAFTKDELPLNATTVERPIRALPTHLLTEDQSYRLHFRALDGSSSTGLVCPDGLAFSAGDPHLFGICNGHIQRVADGVLEDTGMRAVEGTSPGDILHVQPGAYALVHNPGEGHHAPDASIQLLDPNAVSLARLDRPASAHSSDQGPTTATAYVHSFRATAAGVVAAIEVDWEVLLGDAGLGVFSERAITVLSVDGALQVYPAGTSIGNAWFPDDVERAYWVDGSVLRSVDLSTGEILDRSAGFHFWNPGY